MSKEQINKSNIKLNPGDVICNICEGKGFIIKENIHDDDNDYLFKTVNNICNKCYGAGKLDWIENVVGKMKPKKESFFKSPSIKLNYSNIFKEYENVYTKEIIEEVSNKIRDNIDDDIIKYNITKYLLSKFGE